MLPVMLTVDLGPDDAVHGEGRSDALSWERTARGLATMTEAFRSLENDLGAAMAITWFVRADAAVERHLGSGTAVLRMFAPLLSRAAQAGHELAWLAQLPGEMDARALDDLARIHSGFVAEAFAPKSARAGELRHDNASMAALDALGIAFDSSALPGRVRRDGGWRLDWAGTPAHPYHPSVADYRRPGEPHRRIIEIPFTTVPIRAPYDAAPLARY